MRQKVLIIEDSTTIHMLVRSRLADEPIDIHSAYTGESGIVMAHSIQPDLILLDVEMPDPNGFETCRRLKANTKTHSIPVIFLTGASSIEQKIQGWELGAVDYVTKPFEPAELRARVRASLRTKYLLDLLTQKAMIDGLTGLWNRGFLDQRLVAELSMARRQNRPLAVIMADIDHFKQLNDHHGHPFGDQVLRGVAQSLVSECRAEDVVCRYGGEEFAILSPGVPASGAALLAERLRTRIAELTPSQSGKTIKVTASFGISGTDIVEADALIQAADQALYRAKASGRNAVSTAPAEVQPTPGK